MLGILADIVAHNLRVAEWRKEIERLDWDIAHMRGPAVATDLDWRIPMARRPMVDGDL